MHEKDNDCFLGEAKDLETRRYCKFETPPPCPRAKSLEWLFNEGSLASPHSPHPTPPVISLDAVETHQISEEYWTLSSISIIEGSTDILSLPPSLPLPTPFHQQQVCDAAINRFSRVSERLLFSGN